MKREKESSFKENLVLWITGFIVLGLVLCFIIRDKNRDVPLEEYEYIKNISIGSFYDTTYRHGCFSFIFSCARAKCEHIWSDHHHCDCDFILFAWC